MNTIIIISIITAVIIFLTLFNNHPLFYKEKVVNWDKYTKHQTFTPEAEPIEKTNGNDKAVLFIHGFPSTPSVYETPSQFCIEKGYDAFAPLLPGFGTDPKHFTETNFTTWFDYISDYYINLRKKYKELHLLGISMGGAITLKLAETFNSEENKPDTITTIAAPVFLNKIFPIPVIQEPMLYILRPLSWFAKPLKPRIKLAGGADQDGYENWTGYNGIFPKQTYSLYMNLKNIKKNLKNINSPAYIIHARTDATVPYKNIFTIQEKIGSSQVRSEILDISQLKRKHHCLFLYTDLQKPLFNSFMHFIEDVQKNYLGRPKKS